jgi:ribosomal protein S18 acetylase RimI-like enzyme
MIVRPVRPADVPICAAIEAACYPEAEAASYARIAKRAALYPEGFLVLEQGGEVVAFLNSGATRRPDLSREELKDLVDHDPDGDSLVIFSVAVRPDLQGRGLSRPLLEAFLSRARDLRKRQVLLLCKISLVPFYRRFGFEDRGSSASTHGNVPWREMRLSL